MKIRYEVSYSTAGGWNSVGMYDDPKDAFKKAEEELAKAEHTGGVLVMRVEM